MPEGGGLTVREQLLEKARDYELRALHHEEIAEAGDLEARLTAASFMTVALVLHELAGIDHQLEEA